jgi:hypothetical protein
MTAAQKQTVYQSVSKTQKKNAAPTGFRATVGALVSNIAGLVITATTFLPEGSTSITWPSTMAVCGMRSAMVAKYHRTRTLD